MSNSVRKVSEDAKLRPFVSSHFDSQTYIKTVIKEGRSEECFNNVATCIEEVNEEIKGYISQNKDVLMSGMQDVALLSERYSLLYSTSQKLQRNVDRLKKEALESYDLIKLRTMELERIHTTRLGLELGLG
jgi:endonuclease III